MHNQLGQPLVATESVEITLTVEREKETTESQWEVVKSLDPNLSCQIHCVDLSVYETVSVRPLTLSVGITTSHR